MKKVVIVGGGTSGLFTAALMQKFWKDKINITLIYDPNNKNIGVGEGTTPVIVDVFKKDLYYDIFESIREVDATIKLGVKFKNWMPNEEYYHGFGQVVYTDDERKQNEELSSNVASLYALLNDKYAGGINFNEASTAIPNDLKDYHFAYHITTDKLVEFLFRYLKDRVILIPDKVIKVNSDGENIQSIICENTGTYKADLFVDATGFDPILMKELNNEWVCLLYTSPSPRDVEESRMPSSA